MNNSERLQSLLNRLKARRKQERLEENHKRKIDDAVEKVTEKLPNG